MLDVTAATLRYWEKEFPTLSPKRSETGQRRYSEDDVNLCRIIRKYLYEDGLSIEAARRKVAVFRKNPPRYAFVCRSGKDALKLLREAKERSSDEHILARIEAVLGWIEQGC